MGPAEKWRPYRTSGTKWLRDIRLERSKSKIPAKPAAVSDCIGRIVPTNFWPTLRENRMQIADALGTLGTGEYREIVF